jgi:glycosyltransferase involved in cell wall biosynthesis
VKQIHEGTRMKILAVIPAHNEAVNLPTVVGGLRDLHPHVEVLVVDDASTDGTSELFPELGVRWLALAQKVGVGGAMRAGLRYARTIGADAVLRLDGDGQHLPEHLNELLQPILDGQADAVVGSRFQEPSGYRASFPRRCVHRALAVCLTRLTHQPVTDPTSGNWAFGPKALHVLGDHYPKGYSEPELLLFMCRNGLRVSEVPVAMRDRQAGRSTLTIPRAMIALARTALAMIVVPLRSAVVRKRHA